MAVGSTFQSVTGFLFDETSTTTAATTRKKDPPTPRNGKRLQNPARQGVSSQGASRSY